MSLRVVSLVPSWTETLLECGVGVVGRSRYCIHPAERIASIPAVGGTKDLSREALAALRPDLLLLDREENPSWMAELGVPVHASDVRSLGDLPRELEALASRLGSPRFAELAGEWRELCALPARGPAPVAELPGVVRWVRRPAREPSRVLYLIWRHPWMTISRGTFIASMLAHLGLGSRIPEFPEHRERYPKIDLADYAPEDTLLLFSTEPYPFARDPGQLAAPGFPAALVDGESFSWFGLRSLRFLQAARRGR